MYRHFITVFGVIFFSFFVGFAQDLPAQEVLEERIVITIENKSFEVELYDTAASRSLLKALPQTIDMTRWGDGEYYGKISKDIDYQGDTLREVFEVGEVALYPSGFFRFYGNSLCIFFGPTPSSKAEEPRMAAEGAPFGRIQGDVSAFKAYAESLENVTVTLKQ